MGKSKFKKKREKRDDQEWWETDAPEPDRIDRHVGELFILPFDDLRLLEFVDPGIDFLE